VDELLCLGRDGYVPDLASFPEDTEMDHGAAPMVVPDHECTESLTAQAVEKKRRQDSSVAFTFQCTRIRSVEQPTCQRQVSERASVAASRKV